MKFSLMFVLMACLVASSTQQRRTSRRIEKSIISYLGTNYLLHDGCPPPLCDAKDPECVRTKNMVRALFSHCTQSEEGQYTGCVTDRIGPSGTITLPVYASICSAMCYETPKNLKRVHRCPHQGRRQHDPELQGLF